MPYHAALTASRPARMTSQDHHAASLNRSPWLREVRGCMQRAFLLSDEEAAAIDADTTPLQVRGWNSLAHVQLILELERACNVVFEADDIAGLASVSAIVGALERLRT
jgi:acyl carrier protein